MPLILVLLPTLNGSFTTSTHTKMESPSQSPFLMKTVTHVLKPITVSEGGILVHYFGSTLMMHSCIIM